MASRAWFSASSCATSLPAGRSTPRIGDFGRAATRAVASHWALRAGPFLQSAERSPEPIAPASGSRGGEVRCSRDGALAMLPCRSPSSRAAGGRQPCQARCRRRRCRRRPRHAPPGWPNSRRSRTWTVPAASAHRPDCVSRLEASWSARAAAPRESSGARAKSHAAAPRQHPPTSPPASSPPPRAARTPRSFSCPRHTSLRPTGLTASRRHRGCTVGAEAVPAPVPRRCSSTSPPRRTLQLLPHSRWLDDRFPRRRDARH